METLNTDVDMVEQNGKKDGDAIIDDMIKTNGAAASANLNSNSFKSSRPNKSKEFSNLNGAEQRKMSTDEPVAATAAAEE